MIATMTSRGRITIPKPIRDHLGAEPGCRMAFVIGRDDEVRLQRSTPASEVAGMLHRPGMKALTVREMNAGIARHLRSKRRLPKAPDRTPS